MKRVAAGVEPAVLSAFRASRPTATWGEFKNERGNETVFDALAAGQGFLCAYCEIQISRALRGEVEHFEPKSTSSPDRNLHLEFGNILACCEGGTREWMADRAQPPIGETMHCGSLKGEQSPKGRMIDPRSLPVTPGIWQTTSRGELSVDREACTAAGVDPTLAASTLDFLGLNRRVLLRLRSAVIEALDDEALATAGTEEAVLPRMLAIAAQYLVPDSQGRLLPFWSTIRAWVGPQAEPFIAANAARIPGLA